LKKQETNRNKNWLLFLPFINFLLIFKVTKFVDQNISELRNEKYNKFGTIWKFKLFNRIIFSLFSLMMYQSLFHNKNISQEFSMFIFLGFVGFLIRTFLVFLFIVELKSINSDLLLSLNNKTVNLLIVD
jgi:pilus assembly protein TadC